MGNVEAPQIEGVEETLTSEEVKRTYDNFYRKFSNGKMSRDEFVKEMGAVGGTASFWEQCFDNFQKDSFIDFTQFMLCLSFYNTKTSVRDKLTFAFQVYDRDNNGTLDPTEVQALIEAIFRVESLTKQDKKVSMKVLKKMLQDASSVSPPISPRNGDNDDNGEEILLEFCSPDTKITLEQWIDTCSNNLQIVKALNSCFLSSLEIRESSMELKSFGHQAAGHGGILRDSDGHLLKSFTDQEWKMYEIFKDITQIQDFLPDYFGRKTRQEDDGSVTSFIVLQDLTKDMKKPCIMDLKMGKNTWEPTAPSAKKLQLSTVDSMSTSQALGFRICGIRSYQITSDSYIIRDKQYGVRQVNQNNIQRALKEFIFNGKESRYQVFVDVLPVLKNIAQWFVQQTKFRFIGSSLIFIFDGASDNSTGIVKMIDFAHTSIVGSGIPPSNSTLTTSNSLRSSQNLLTSPNTYLDESYLFGVKSVIAILEEIISEEVSTKSGNAHQFALHYFTSFTYCNYCNGFIWGVTYKQGYRCTTCAYAAHKECYPLVPKCCSLLPVQIQETQPQQHQFTRAASNRESVRFGIPPFVPPNLPPPPPPSRPPPRVPPEAKQIKKIIVEKPQRPTNPPPQISLSQSYSVTEARRRGLNAVPSSLSLSLSTSGPIPKSSHSQSLNPNVTQ